MSEMTLGILAMPDDLFWNDDPLVRMQHNSARKEACAEITDLRARVKELEELTKEGIQAFDFTRQYIGEEKLPEIKGWSWFDWVTKARAALKGGE